MSEDVNNSKKTNFCQTTRVLVMVIVVNLLLLELLSIAMVHSLAIVKPERRLDITIDNYFANFTDRDLQRYWLSHDSVLGWDRKPFQTIKATNSAGDPFLMTYDPDGARTDPTEHGSVLLTTYGDSFTEGSEVNNDETWQFYLENLINHDVKNFGVSGYGIGQSYLKIKNHFGKGYVAPITMLVIFEDDLRRTLNNFRGFVNLNAPPKLAFKPSYRYLNREIRFFPIPSLDSSMTLEDLKILAMDLAADDYLMAEERLYFSPEFPYSYQVIMAIPRVGQKIFDKFAADPVDESIWSTEEGRLVANHIINNFNRAAIENRTTPIVLFIPRVNAWKDGRKKPPYHAVKMQLEKNIEDGPLIIDVADANFDESKFSILAFKGHPSPYGNQVIAAQIAKKLGEWQLVE